MPFRLKQKFYKNNAAIGFFCKYAAFALIFLFIQRLVFALWNIKFLKREGAIDILNSFLFSVRFDAFLVAWIVAPMLLVLLIFFALELILRLKTPQFLKKDFSKFYHLRIYSFIFTSGFSTLAILFFSTLNLVDTEFIHFTGRRVTVQSFFMFNEASDKLSAYFFVYWPMFLVSFLLLASFGYMWLLLVKKIKLQPAWRENKAPFQYTNLTDAGILFLLVALLVVGARGGLQAKPLSFVDAKRFASPLLDLMMTNSGFSFIKSIDQKKVFKYKFFDKPLQELAAVKAQLLLEQEQSASLEFRRREQVLTDFKSLFPTKPNIVVVILESFSYEYMGFENNQSYTPFLKELSQKSIFFKNAMADGRRSIEGVAALLAGVPAWMEEPFISSEFSSNQFLGLGTYLKKFNYTTSFFHGGKNGTMYFDSFSKAAGFENYFGLNEYPEKEKHFDGNWGIFDHYFFQDVITKTNQMRTPFLDVIFTLSSHHPYKIPDEFASQFPSTEPWPILRSVQYADESLKRFFSEAQKQSWYNETIFILIADHTGKPKDETFDHTIGSFRIPLLIYTPKLSEEKVFTSEKVVSQKDILSFIQALVDPHAFHADKNDTQFVFSKGLFDRADDPQIVFDGVKYFVYGQNCLIEWSLESGAMSFRLDKNFRRIHKEGIEQCSQEQKDLYEKYLKINLQLFSELLFDNRLYAPVK